MVGVSVIWRPYLKTTKNFNHVFDSFILVSVFTVGIRPESDTFTEPAFYRGDEAFQQVFLSCLASEKFGSTIRNEF